MVNPKVGIAVLNWNGLADTLACLKSLRKITYKNTGIYVVDNGSKSDVATLRRQKGITLIENSRNEGFCKGNNQAMKKALASGAEYMLLLNNDTEVHPEFLGKLVHVAESSTSIGLVGPKIYYYNSPRIWFGGGNFNFWIGNTHHKETESMKKQYVDYITGCALLVKRNVIDRIGMLDERFFAYYEEVDFALRARRAGFKAVYIPSAVIWHKVGAATKRMNHFAIRLNLRNRMLLMRKHARWYHFLTFIPCYTTSVILLLGYRTLRGDFKSVQGALQGVYEGITC